MATYIWYILIFGVLALLWRRNFNEAQRDLRIKFIFTVVAALLSGKNLGESISASEAIHVYRWRPAKSVKAKSLDFIVAFHAMKEMGGNLDDSIRVASVVSGYNGPWRRRGLPSEVHLLSDEQIAYILCQK